MLVQLSQDFFLIPLLSFAARSTLFARPEAGSDCFWCYTRAIRICHPICPISTDWPSTPGISLCYSWVNDKSCWAMFQNVKETILWYQTGLRNTLVTFLLLQMTRYMIGILCHSSVAWNAMSCILSMLDQCDCCSKVMIGGPIQLTSFPESIVICF